MEVLLDVQALSAHYGPIAVLHGIDLTLEQGAVATILGANGAGKTTLLRALTAMVHTHGTVRLGGRRIDGLSTERIVRLGMAHVPQGRGIFARMSVDENLRLGSAFRTDRGAIGSDLQQIFEHFPVLGQRRAQQAGSLSGGEQQMLAVARALMQRPRLLLLDEPSFGLAPLLIETLYQALVRINREQGVTMLIVEQNVHLALQLAHLVHVMEAGRIVLSGSAQYIADHDSVRCAYLGY